MLQSGIQNHPRRVLLIDALDSRLRGNDTALLTVREDADMAASISIRC